MYDANSFSLDAQSAHCAQQFTSAVRFVRHLSDDPLCARRKPLPANTRLQASQYRLRENERIRRQSMSGPGRIYSGSIPAGDESPCQFDVPF